MSTQLTISKFVRMNNAGLWLNGEPVLTQPTGEIKAYLQQLYSQLGVQYPKFYKMDSLCQLAYIGAQLLLKDDSITNLYASSEIGAVFANKASSLDTDRRFHETICDSEAYFPSPAVFVYTLPSIMSGEIAISEGIKGENNFLVAAEFNPHQQVEYLTNLFATKQVQACVAGWVELDFENFDVLMYIVEEQTTGIQLSTIELKQLYTAKF